MAIDDLEFRRSAREAEVRAGMPPAPVPGGSILRTSRAALAQGLYSVELGKLGAKHLAGTATPEELQRFDDLRRNPPPGIQSGSALETIAEYSVQTLPYIADVALSSYQGAGAGLAGGAALGITGGPAATVALGFSGAAAGATLGALASIAQIEMGGSYAQMLDLAAELKGEGHEVDPLVIKGLAVSVGAANAFLERWGLGYLVETLPAGALVRGALGRAAVKEAMRSPTLASALAGFAKRFGK